MSALSDKLKKDNGEVTPSLEVGLPTTEDANGGIGGTGNEGTTEEPVVTDEFPAELTEQIVKTALAEAASYEPSEGSFENIRLHSVITSNGTKVTPNAFGYYEKPEGEVKDILEYFATKGLVRVVGKVVGKLLK